jgi:catechol 2,3-dioxygenase
MEMNFHTAPVNNVSEVTINVSDLKKSLDFYQEIIGFKVKSQTGKEAELSADGKTTLLRLTQPSNPINRHRTSGLYHFALLLPDRSDLAAFIKHLSTKDIRLGASDHAVSEALYLDDPDGNGIEIYRDRAPEEWSWNNEEVHMVTDPLDVEGVMAAYKDEPFTGLPEDTVMGHLHLHVSDIEDAVKFYTEGLGMEVVTRYGPQAAFLSFDKYHHHVAVNVWNGVGAPPPAKNSIGLNYYIMKYHTPEAVDHTVNNLESLGYKVEETPEGMFSEDPAGNRVLISE